MSAVILLVIVAMWAAFLVPAFLRREGGGGSLGASASRTSARLQERLRQRERVLPRRSGPAAPRYVAGSRPGPPRPRPAAAAGRARLDAARGAVLPASTLPSARSRHAAAVRRRRLLVAVVVVVDLATLVLALAVGGFAWVGHGVADLLLAGLLLRLRQLHRTARARRLDADRLSTAAPGPIQDLPATPVPAPRSTPAGDEPMVPADRPAAVAGAEPMPLGSALAAAVAADPHAALPCPAPLADPAAATAGPVPAVQPAAEPHPVGPPVPAAAIAAGPPAEAAVAAGQRSPRRRPRDEAVFDILALDPDFVHPARVQRPRARVGQPWCPVPVPKPLYLATPTRVDVEPGDDAARPPLRVVNA